MITRTDDFYAVDICTAVSLICSVDRDFSRIEVCKFVLFLSSVDSGAVGVICADRHGLALHSSGPVQLKSAGVIATLASLAKEIDPSCDTTPTIHLESDTLDILIQQKELVTVAVYSAAKK
uniref:Late endosomal/lysosomal adaptor and MAPK and MTOR activator 5 n=1 Tax=Amblyomma maculatum TaxID=34609 RepID=G3MTJ0_AMBMU